MQSGIIPVVDYHRGKPEVIGKASVSVDGQNIAVAATIEDHFRMFDIPEGYVITGISLNIESRPA